MLVVGEASIAHEHTEISERDLRRGERVGIPIALIILIVLFGTLVAVSIPVGLSLVAIGVALGIAAVVGQALELSTFVALMIIMIGLAVGIDYSILVISRFREERARGLGVQEAIERSGATAGRTVLFSGVTVVIALGGMLIVPFSLMRSLGLGAILVVLVALAATLTALPAGLAVLGPRLHRLAVPYFGRRAARLIRSRRRLRTGILGVHDPHSDAPPGGRHRGGRGAHDRRDPLLLPVARHQHRDQHRLHLPGGRGDEGGLPRHGGGVLLRAGHPDRHRRTRRHRQPRRAGGHRRGFRPPSRPIRESRSCPPPMSTTPATWPI